MLHNFQQTIKIIFYPIAFLSIFLLHPTITFADIYRFVTIDGVESFTDAPVDKGAQVIIKERQKGKSKKHKKEYKQQKTHNISLEEIITKAVQASQNGIIPGETSEEPLFEIALPPVGGKITSTVGMRIDPIDGKWRYHNGIDIAIPSGTPVLPVADGTVIYSGQRSGYGNTVLIEHNNGVISLYAHNSKLLVSSGQHVTAKTEIALSGSTGRSTGPHLHFEAWQTGTNITAAFMPDGDKKIPYKLAAVSPSKAASFRKEILSDGTILFTNLP